MSVKVFMNFNHLTGPNKYNTSDRSKLSALLPAQLRRSHPSSAKHAACGVPIPPEALFSWNQADFEIYVATWRGLCSFMPVMTIRQLYQDNGKHGISLPEGKFILKATCELRRLSLSFFEASAGYVKPKLKVSYYLSPECPQTIVDLVSPSLREMNWTCSVAQQAEIPPIFIWEGSRRSIDPAPTLSRGGLVNRVSGAFSVTTKVGMLKAVCPGIMSCPVEQSQAFQASSDINMSQFTC